MRKSLLVVVGAAAACQSDLDCELLGTCAAGVCMCAAGFTGPSCGQLDLLPVPAATRGRVWPRSTAPYVTHDAAPHGTLGWSFAPAYDPASRRFVAAVEAVCDKWGGDVWLAAVSSDRPDGGWRFDRRLGPAGTNCPHLRRLANGTFALVFDALTSGIFPANETKDPAAPVCVGDAVPCPAAMAPVLRPCGADEAPSLGHDCLCSRASRHCPSVHSGVYVATTAAFPAGPWRIAPLRISGAGWSPYNASLASIGTSNPTAVQLQDGRSLLSIRSHAGYWPGVKGEHTAFALSDSIEGPFAISGNLSWQFGNDEDPFVWQQPDGTMHCLYHNGRSKHTNHGLHAFSRDGVAWHKPADALLPKCAFGNASTPVTPSLHNCSAMYGDAVALDDGSRIVLTGRERPALLFDEATGAPTYLFNGAIDANQSVPWYAMAQAIKIKQEAHKI